MITATAIAELEPILHSGLGTRGVVEKPRNLRERDRSLIIEAARRVTLTQERCDRRDWGGREFCANRFSFQAIVVGSPVTEK